VPPQSINADSRRSSCDMNAAQAPVPSVKISFRVAGHHFRHGGQGLGHTGGENPLVCRQRRLGQCHIGGEESTFNVRLVPGGIASTYIHNLKVGDPYAEELYPLDASDSVQDLRGEGRSLQLIFGGTQVKTITRIGLIDLGAQEPRRGVR